MTAGSGEDGSRRGGGLFVNYVQRLELFSYIAFGTGIGSAIGVLTGIGAAVIFDGTSISSYPGIGGTVGLIIGLVAGIGWYVRKSRRNHA